MNSGYWLAGLGVLALVIGGATWALDWHHTIEEGGVGVGVILILIGLYISSGGVKPKAFQPGQPAAPA